MVNYIYLGRLKTYLFGLVIFVFLITPLAFEVEVAAAELEVAKEPFMDVLPRLHEDEPDQCPDCPPVFVISINGINANFDSPFHNWSQDTFKITPGSDGLLIDPFHGVGQFCGAQPLKPGLIDDINQIIQDIRDENPCAIILVIGHSMGGITAFGVTGADCVAILDPPKCRRGAAQICPSMRHACKAEDDGIKDQPLYWDWEGEGLPHTPFGDPETNCDQLYDVEVGIRACLQSHAPNCNDFGFGPLICELEPDL